MPKPPNMKIENVLQPGKTYSVDAGKFEAMRVAVMKVLPASPPGMTPADIQKAVLAHLPQDLFAGGDKAGWWMKAVQLDQEAKKLVVRSPKAPVRLWKA
jgi:hypothetical protein